ncbi:MAG TPA: hypothetical protein VF633_04280 [Brevundimonas sp.]|jgi:hypothetical protein
MNRYLTTTALVLALAAGAGLSSCDKAGKAAAPAVPAATALTAPATEAAPETESAELPPLIPDIAAAHNWVRADQPPEERAVACAALTALQLQAIDAGAPGDKAAIKAAYDAWNAELIKQTESKDSADQYFASTFAVLDDTPPAPLKAAADDCAAHKP